jgi:hypothetical protein
MFGINRARDSSLKGVRWIKRYWMFEIQQVLNASVNKGFLEQLETMGSDVAAKFSMQGGIVDYEYKVHTEGAKQNKPVWKEKETKVYRKSEQNSLDTSCENMFQLQERTKSTGCESEKNGCGCNMKQKILSQVPSSRIYTVKIQLLLLSLCISNNRC